MAHMIRFLLALLILTGTGTAAATPDTDAKQHFEAGIAFHGQGRFDDALREFQAGYALVRNPKFLLNIGQTYRRLGRLDDARASLLEYMATLAGSDERRISVAHVVAELDLELKEKVPPPPSPARIRARRAAFGLFAAAGASLVAGATLIGVGVRDDQFLANPPLGWSWDGGRTANERQATFASGITLLSLTAALVVAGGVTYHLSRPSRF